MTKKLALCVGLNYPGTNAALSGCVNDATDWHDELVRRGYEVRTLLEPTKLELVAELKGMIARARYRDKVVFTFSGHGTWIADRDGDEADGRDEALCCKDYARGGLLLDDEIQQIFGEARFGVRRLIVSDSCHSGSVSRFAGPQLIHLGASEAEVLDITNRKARFMPPDQFLDGVELERAREAESLPAKGISRKGTVLLSGCADTEYSYDARFNGRPNGAMSYFALQALKAGATSVRDVHRFVRRTLPSGAYPQTPQLTVLPHQGRWSFL